VPDLIGLFEAKRRADFTIKGDFTIVEALDQRWRKGKSQ
jgi:hypothetical protein